MGQKQVRTKYRYSEDFKRYYATGVVGASTPMDVRLGFYRDNVIQPEEPDMPSTAEREILVELTMAPIAVLNLRDFLNRQLEIFNIKRGKPEKDVKPGVG